MIGSRDDRQPLRSGITEMLAVVHLLEDNQILCCAVAESALIYYGAGKQRNVSDSLYNIEHRFYGKSQDWVICIPTNDLAKATDLIGSHDKIYSRFRPSAMKALRGLPYFRVCAEPPGHEQSCGLG